MFLVAENGWRCPRRMDGTSRCTRCTMQDTRRCAGVTEPAFNRRDFKEAYSGKESDPVQPCRKNIIFVSSRIACTRRPDRRYGNIAFTDGHFSACGRSKFRRAAARSGRPAVTICRTASGQTGQDKRHGETSIARPCTQKQQRTTQKRMNGVSGSDRRNGIRAGELQPACHTLGRPGPERKK